MRMCVGSRAKCITSKTLLASLGQPHGMRISSLRPKDGPFSRLLRLYVRSFTRRRPDDVSGDWNSTGASNSMARTSPATCSKSTTAEGGSWVTATPPKNFHKEYSLAFTARDALEHRALKLSSDLERLDGWRDPLPLGLLLSRSRDSSRDTEMRCLTLVATCLGPSGCSGNPCF